ncbi:MULTISPECIES: NAD-dependent epimerase/dehydratase family protein [Pseudomonadota]|jgi:UDP-glucuronate 4-epimerase|uniref:NAD-dependent epimerase/dehydratase family protein n=3 Tax=Pseudomonadota TaxID=1224 RepID=UPI00076A8AF8|nr:MULTISPECIES: NAD-dependent epimerase/dehydratase family protein [Pseudomonadota]MAF62850.1 protein CapI [Blastomonas sp.]|tara:strand:- start:5280 stop:6278 length:999 start_codon:yes stop_codon:yes gene_type:complete
MTIIVTGAAGFIGHALTRALMQRGEHVVGIDNLNPYYDPALKHARIADLATVDSGRFDFAELDFADHEALETALAPHKLSTIVHLGAQAGVRYSIDNPRAYVQSNLVGHLNLLEIARHRDVRQFVYASSSSVYGNSDTVPFSVDQRVDHPISLYAATKKADELMSETYAHLYRLPMTGLRFFTVYGPWGRPDMALWKFTSAILQGKPIDVYNHGDMRRDFTYIDDIIAGVLAVIDHPPADDGEVKPGGSVSPHRLYNIGNNQPEPLGRMIDVIEAACGRQAIRNMLPMQPGDVYQTYADISAIAADLGYAPSTGIDIGIPRFVDWYRGYTGS